MGGGAALVGTRRAGMHQASEHEFQRTHMATDEHHPETPEDALDMPGAVEAEIPPVEEDDDEIVEEIAEGDAGIAAEEEILEEVADPEASENEEEAAAPETEEETLGIRIQDSGSSRAALDVDYSSERIPEMMPPVSGGVAPETELIYSPGDGEPKEIQEPLPGMGEKLGIPPIINGIIDPSANVAAAPEPEAGE